MLITQQSTSIQQHSLKGLDKHNNLTQRLHPVRNVTAMSIYGFSLTCLLLGKTTWCGLTSNLTLTAKEPKGVFQVSFPSSSCTSSFSVIKVVQRATARFAIGGG